MWSLEQEHADRLALHQQVQKLQEESEQQGHTHEETQMRIQQAVGMHKEAQQIRQQHAKELIAVEQEAVKEGCLPSETRRRVHARSVAHAEERKARERHMEACNRVQLEARAKGLNEEQMKAAVTQAVAALKEEHGAKVRAWQAQERKARGVATAALRALQESGSYPAVVRQLMLSRVRIDGLKARPELNGRCGTVAAYKSAVDGKPGRLAVTVDGESAPVLLKAEALTVVGFDDEPLIAAGADDADDEPPPLL